MAGDPGDLLVAGDGRTAIVTREADSRIDVIDLATHSVIKAIDLGEGSAGGTLHFAPNGRLVLVTPRTMRAHARIVDVMTMTALLSVSLAGPAKATALTARQLSYVAVVAYEAFVGAIPVTADSPGRRPDEARAAVARLAPRAGAASRDACHRDGRGERSWRPVAVRGSRSDFADVRHSTPPPDRTMFGRCVLHVDKPRKRDESQPGATRSYV